uniref:RNI-like protein n=1 Tax=Strongyloides venezuelensis TaxID=75913 RepID=A0A0K0FFV3_STRVS
MTIFKFFDHGLSKGCYEKMFGEREHIPCISKKYRKYFENKHINKTVKYNYDNCVEINIDCFKSEGDYFYSEPIDVETNFLTNIINNINYHHGMDTLIYKKQLSIVVALPGLSFDVSMHDYKRIINDTFLNEIIFEIKKAEKNVDAVIINFNHSHGFINHIIAPYIISRYGSSNIKVIKLNLFCFLQKLDQEEVLKKVDIFRGYEKFNKLVIYENFALPQKTEAFDEGSLFMHTLKCLSRRKNATLKIEVPQDGNIKLSFLRKTFKAADELNIRVKFSISIGCEKRGYKDWHEKIKILESDIAEYITHIECFIQDQNEFLHIIELLPTLENLTKLKIIFYEFNIQELLAYESQIEFNDVSLKNLLKFTNFSIKIKHQSFDKIDFSYREICNIHNQFVRYFAKILPPTITFIELENVLYLTPQLCILMNESTPNIQYFFANHVDFANQKCLTTFSNVKYLKLLNCPSVEIPNNVELLIHKYSSSCKAPLYVGEDGDVEEEYKRQDRKYSLSFTKTVHDITRDYKFYFNKLSKWGYYKDIIEKKLRNSSIRNLNYLLIHKFLRICINELINKDGKSICDFKFGFTNTIFARMTIKQNNSQQVKMSFDDERYLKLYKKVKNELEGVLGKMGEVFDERKRQENKEILAKVDKLIRKSEDNGDTIYYNNL